MSFRVRQVNERLNQHPHGRQHAHSAVLQLRHAPPVQGSLRGAGTLYFGKRRERGRGSGDGGWGREGRGRGREGGGGEGKGEGEGGDGGQEGGGDRGRDDILVSKKTTKNKGRPMFTATQDSGADKLELV